MHERTQSGCHFSRSLWSTWLCAQFFIALSLACVVSTAQAESFTPNTVSELVAAFEKASSNLQDDVIDLRGQSFELSAELELHADEGHGLELRDGVLFREENAPAFRLLHLHEVPYMYENIAPVSINAVEFRNGLQRVVEVFVEAGGGGALLSHRNTKIRDSRFHNNQVHGFTSGGAIRHSQSLELANVVFTNNAAVADTEFQVAIGGAIGIDDGGSLFASNSYFLGNSADEGGAIHAAHGVTYLNITRSAFDGNRATALGGAIWSSVGEGEMRVSNSTFVANQAPEGGAAFEPCYPETAATSC